MENDFRDWIICWRVCESVAQCMYSFVVTVTARKDVVDHLSHVKNQMTTWPPQKNKQTKTF